MNADESRRLYAGVELHRPLACSEVRDQTFAHRCGHRVRLNFLDRGVSENTDAWTWALRRSRI